VGLPFESDLEAATRGVGGMTTLTCEREGCETPFKVTHPLKRFCSESCQRAAEKERYRRRHTEQAVCLNCGGSFERVAIGKAEEGLLLQGLPVRAQVDSVPYPS
jgi:predicted nucleic acid-binding Zn ribbon protein